jgi:pilus assembly protein Flp/PilA
MFQMTQAYVLALIHRFRRDEQGAALVEYGILVGLIAVICIAAVTIVGTQVSVAFSKIASQLTSAFGA